MLLLPLPHGSMSPTASSAHAELPALLMLAVCGGKGDYVLAPVDNPREGVSARGQMFIVLQACPDQQGIGISSMPCRSQTNALWSTTAQPSRQAGAVQVL